MILIVESCPLRKSIWGSKMGFWGPRIWGRIKKVKNAANLII